MRLSKYETFILKKDAYWFVSTGKQGVVYKVVLFQPLTEPNRFNLAMGDINLQTSQIEFDELSGNRDARKVFATIAEIIKEYTEIYPDKEILVSGNTDDKKRSYSFITAWYLDEALTDFYIWGGDAGGEFELFKKDIVYDAILVKRK